MARAGRLRGERVGRDWTFTKQAIEEFKKLERPAHRPPSKPRAELANDLIRGVI
jgi:hypothetical protein